MDKLSEEARELERQAKAEEDLNKRANLFLEAAKIWQQIGDGRKSKWNLANYYSEKGEAYSYRNEFGKARECFKKAEELHLELNLAKAACYCASKYISTYHFELKERASKIPPVEYFELAEKFLKDYEDYSETPEYKTREIELYKNKAFRYQLNAEYKNAAIYEGKAFKLAEYAYNKFGFESYKESAIFFKHMYWNQKAREFEAEKNFEEAAEAYKKSAEIISEIDEHIGDDEYINYYKCLAIKNKYNEEELTSAIDKAIELAEKGTDERQKAYLIGFKYDHLAKFAENIEERIELYNQAKENFYKSGDESSGRVSDFVLSYNISRKELKNANYGQALFYLDKTMSLAKYVLFPNILPSFNTLKIEKFLYKGYLYFSQLNFPDAAKSLTAWLDGNKEVEKTRRYQFYRVLRDCTNLINKASPCEEDLYSLEHLLQYTRKNKLSLVLYTICSLTHSYISLWMHNIGDSKTLEEIKLALIGKIGKEEIVEDLKRRLEVQRAIEGKDWLLRLPPIFAEKFDSCFYFLGNVLEEYKHAAIREFYILLEHFLRVVIAFNAKVMWHSDWKLELEKEVADNRKSYEEFTFGDLVRSLRLLKDSHSEFCKDVPEEIFDLFNKHVPIRNILAHDLFGSLPEFDFDIVEDTSKTMYSLSCCFPTHVKIISTSKRPWYDAEILWNSLPRRALLYSEEHLKKDNLYYTEPIRGIINGKLRPKVILEAEKLPEKLT